MSKKITVTIYLDDISDVKIDGKICSNYYYKRQLLQIITNFVTSKYDGYQHNKEFFSKIDSLLQKDWARIDEENWRLIQ